MARLRYFGGTSGHWNGACPDLDAASFLPNPLNGTGDGWPIRKADLDPYAAEAADILDLTGPVAGGHQPARPDRRPPGDPVAPQRADPVRREISRRDHRLRPDPRSGSTPTSSTSGSIRASTGSPRQCSGPSRRTTRASPSRRPSCALHRRHRERAAAAQFRQPDAGRHRQRARPGRPLLLRPSGRLPRRGAVRGAAGAAGRQLLRLRCPNSAPRTGFSA